MTSPRLGFTELLETASQLGCVGVEVRNDLQQALFSGLPPVEAKEIALEIGQQLLAVAEVKNFNHWSGTVAARASGLIEIAQACGAQAVILIPTNDGDRIEPEQQKERLLESLSELNPLLQHAGLSGYVEPLGFASCSIRTKSSVVEVIEELNMQCTFKLVHDTFHHTLSGESQLFPEHTAMVHVSGVVNAELGYAEMQDSHRVLVDASDRLGNIKQLAALFEGGYDGPVSFEAFSPEVHAFNNPVAELNKSVHYIESTLQLTG